MASTSIDSRRINNQKISERPQKVKQEKNSGEAWMKDYRYYLIWGCGVESSIKVFVASTLFIDSSLYVEMARSIDVSQSTPRRATGVK